MATGPKKQKYTSDDFDSASFDKALTKVVQSSLKKAFGKGSIGVTPVSDALQRDITSSETLANTLKSLAQHEQERQINASRTADIQRKAASEGISFREAELRYNVEERKSQLIQESREKARNGIIDSRSKEIRSELASLNSSLGILSETIQQEETRANLVKQINNEYQSDQIKNQLAELRDVNAEHAISGERIGFATGAFEKLKQQSIITREEQIELNDILLNNRDASGMIKDINEKILEAQLSGNEKLKESLSIIKETLSIDQEREKLIQKISKQSDGYLKTMTSLSDKIPIIGGSISKYLEGGMKRYNEALADSIIKQKVGEQGLQHQGKAATALGSKLKAAWSSFGPGGMVLIGIGLLAAGLAAAYNFVKDFDKSITDTAQSMGTTKQAAQELAMAANATTLNQKEHLAAVKELNTAYGGMNAVNAKNVNQFTDQLKTINDLKTGFGLTSDEVTGLAASARSMGTDVTVLTANVLSTVEALESQGNYLVNQAAVMKDIGKLGKANARMFGNNAKALVKAAVAANMLGTNLGSMLKTAEDSLDIEQSLTKEALFQVFTGGKNVSLHEDMMKMREAYVNNDMESVMQAQGNIIANSYDSIIDASGKANQFALKKYADMMGQTTDEAMTQLESYDLAKSLGFDIQQIMSGEISVDMMEGKMADIKDPAQKARIEEMIAKRKSVALSEEFDRSLQKLKESLTPLMGQVAPAIESIVHFGAALSAGITKVSSFVGGIGGMAVALGALVLGFIGFRKLFDTFRSSSLGETLLGKTKETKQAEAVKTGMKSALDYYSASPSLAVTIVANKIKGGDGDGESGSANGKSPDTKEMSKKGASESFKDNMKNIAEGFKAMGESGVGKGILNTALAGPALLLAIPAIPFILFMGKSKLDSLENNFYNLASGLTAMGEAGRSGILNTALAGPALLLGMLGIPMLTFMGKIKLGNLFTNFSQLASGLTAMSAVPKSGILNIGLFGIAAIPSLLSIPFLTFMGLVPLAQLAVNFTSLGTGLSALSAGIGGVGVLAAFAIAAILAIPSLIFLGGIALLGEVAAAGLIALGVGLEALGAVAATGLPFLAVGLIAALGASMIPFAAALYIATPAIEALGKVVIGVFSAMPAIITAVANGFVTIFDTLAENWQVLIPVGIGLTALAVGVGVLGAASLLAAPGLLVLTGMMYMAAPAIAAVSASMTELIPVFEALATIDSKQIIALGKGLVVLGAGLLALTAGSVVNGIASFFGAGPVDMLKDLASIDGQGVNITAQAITSLASALQGFSSIDTTSIGNGLGSIAAGFLALTAGSVINGIADFFGAGPVDLLKDLTSVDGKSIESIAKGIDVLVKSIDQFTSIDLQAMEDTIGKVEELSDINSSGIGSLLSSIGSGIGGAMSSIVTGVQSVAAPITDALSGAFDSAYNEISGWFGFSPSEIGNSILNGIQSVSPDISSNLTQPFDNAASKLNAGPLKNFGDNVAGIDTAKLKEQLGQFSGVLSGIDLDAITKFADLAEKDLGKAAQNIVNGINSLVTINTGINFEGLYNTFDTLGEAFNELGIDDLIKFLSIDKDLKTFGANIQAGFSSISSMPEYDFGNFENTLESLNEALAESDLSDLDQFTKINFSSLATIATNLKAGLQGLVDVGNMEDMGTGFMSGMLGTNGLGGLESIFEGLENAIDELDLTELDQFTKLNFSGLSTMAQSLSAGLEELNALGNRDMGTMFSGMFGTGGLGGLESIFEGLSDAVDELDMDALSKFTTLNVSGLSTTANNIKQGISDLVSVADSAGQISILQNVFTTLTSVFNSIDPNIFNRLGQLDVTGITIFANNFKNALMQLSTLSSIDLSGVVALSTTITKLTDLISKINFTEVFKPIIDLKVDPIIQQIDRLIEAFAKLTKLQSIQATVDVQAIADKATEVKTTNAVQAPMPEPAKAFAEGGYTGPGSKYEPAGVTVQPPPASTVTVQANDFMIEPNANDNIGGVLDNKSVDEMVNLLRQMVGLLGQRQTVSLSNQTAMDIVKVANADRSFRTF